MLVILCIAFGGAAGLLLWWLLGTVMYNLLYYYKMGRSEVRLLDLFDTDNTRAHVSMDTWPVWPVVLLILFMAHYGELLWGKVKSKLGKVKIRLPRFDDDEVEVDDTPQRHCDCGMVVKLSIIGWSPTNHDEPMYGYLCPHCGRSVYADVNGVVSVP